MLAVDSGAANDLASQVKRLTEDADTFQKSQQDTQELVSASVSWSLGGHMVVTWWQAQLGGHKHLDDYSCSCVEFMG